MLLDSSGVFPDAQAKNEVKNQIFITRLIDKKQKLGMFHI